MRARLIGGLPADLVGSLTGLTQGHFPVHAKARYADDIDDSAIAKKRITKGQTPRCRSSASSTRAGHQHLRQGRSPVIAVQDGKIIKIGRATGWASSSSCATSTATVHVRAPEEVRRAPTRCPRRRRSPARGHEGAAPGGAPKDPKPTAPARAGTQVEAKAPAAAPAADAAAPPRPRRDAPPPRSRKERVFANPSRPGAYAPAARSSCSTRAASSPAHDLQVLVHRVYGLKRRTSCSRARPAARSSPARSSGASARTEQKMAPHMLFEVRPAGHGAPRIDPEADPRRLEAARDHRDLPRRRQEPVLRPGLEEPDDRPDPADEQGGAAAARARRPAHRHLRVRPARHQGRRRSTAACWPRWSSCRPTA